MQRNGWTYMSINLESADVEVRERRLKSVLTYQGTAADLNERSKSDSLKTAKRAYQQCSDCSQMCAATLTYAIQNAAVVVHSPIGCFSETSATDVGLESVSRARGTQLGRVQAVCTNIQEKDTVYGAVEKLRYAIDEAQRRYHPQAIFVQSSCAAGIIGDDIESVTEQKAEEYGIPIVPVFCEGFKSRIWTTGFDAVFHGILRKMVQPPRQRRDDVVNIFNFMGSDSFSPLLGKLGLKANYLVPLADVDAITHMSEAACTAHICETLATYIAKGLEQEYGVPEVKAPAPFGLEWTDEWLREVARHTGREHIVEDVIAAEHERIQPALDRVRKELDGATVFVFAGDSYAHSLTNMAIDLGLKPVGVTTLHHDQRTDEGGAETDTLGRLIHERGDIANFTVCNRQPYQMLKVIRDANPDLLIVRHMNMTIMGTKLGIPTVLEGDVNVSAGYDGLVGLGERLLKAARGKRLLRNIADHVEWPYTDWWLDQDDTVYGKEVR